RARGTQEHDVLLASPDALRNLRYRGRLVAGRLVVGLHVERRHPAFEVGHWPHATSLRATAHYQMLHFRHISSSIRPHWGPEVFMLTSDRTAVHVHRTIHPDSFSRGAHG